MELNSKEILKVLRDKGIQTLHHANTVETSCLFLQKGRLLSRGTVDEQQLEQTAQTSDGIDKKYGIWYDVFLDSVDIHERAKSRNVYGPVLFRFDLALLDEDWLPFIWVTKKNPTKWVDGESMADRYFTSVEEFARDYKKGDFNCMFMLRNAGGILRLDRHLEDIKLDDPQWEYKGIDVYSQSVGALRASAWQGGLKDIEIVKRECHQECKCRTQYPSILKSFGTGNAYGKKTAGHFFFMSDETPAPT